MYYTYRITQALFNIYLEIKVSLSVKPRQKPNTFWYRPSLEKCSEQLTVTLYTLSIYPSVHKQLILTLSRHKCNAKRDRISWLWHYIHYLYIPLYTNSWSEPFSRHKFDVHWSLKYKSIMSEELSRVVNLWHVKCLHEKLSWTICFYLFIEADYKHSW